MHVLACLFIVRNKLLAEHNKSGPYESEIKKWCVVALQRTRNTTSYERTIRAVLLLIYVTPAMKKFHQFASGIRDHYLQHLHTFCQHLCDLLAQSV